MRTLLSFSCLVSGLAVVSIGCGADEPSPRPRCEQLRDHLIDVRLANMDAADREAHRTTMRASLDGEFMAQCAKLPTTRVNCALAASDAAGVRACTGGAR